MSNKTKIYLPLIIVCSIIVGMYLASYIHPKSNLLFNQRQNNELSSKFDEVLSYIDAKYVDSVDNNKLEEIAIENMLDSLDPHSVYLSAKDLKADNEIIQGNFEGIGVQFRIEKDTVFVVNTVQGGPSEKIGIRAGDRIITVNDKNIAGKGIKNTDVQKLLKGAKGTTVKVGIARRGIKDVLNFNIVRNVIPNKSVDIAYMIKPTIGYIKISSFSMTTADEFRSAMHQLEFQGMKGLILDLRDNGGGLLKSAVEVVSEFLDKGSVIVFTEGLNSPRSNIESYFKGSFLNGKLVVLVDEASASSSEIVTGAIQDHDRGTIVGRTTFGKGLVQEQIPLNDSSAIRLTVARYHTPSGRCIQRSYANGKSKYFEDYYERYLSGELMYADSIHQTDTTQKYYTDKKRVVYGGGGITPDVFVPLENLKNNEFYYQLLNKSILFKYSFDYTDKNRPMLNAKYQTVKSFINNFTVTDAMMQDILKEAKASNITFNSIGYNKAKNEIKVLIKSYIGRNLFDYDGFYPIYNSIDHDVIKALEVMERL